jgi:hypothetical protein
MRDVRPDRPTGLALVKTWSDRVRLPVVYASVGLVVITLYLGGFLGPAREFLLPAALGVLVAFGIQSLQTIERQTGPERIKEFADDGWRAARRRRVAPPSVHARGPDVGIALRAVRRLVRPRPQPAGLPARALGGRPDRSGRPGRPGRRGCVPMNLS